MGLIIIQIVTNTRPTYLIERVRLRDKSQDFQIITFKPYLPPISLFLQLDRDHH